MKFCELVSKLLIGFGCFLSGLDSAFTEGDVKTATILIALSYLALKD